VALSEFPDVEPEVKLTAIVLEPGVVTAPHHNSTPWMPSIVR
jgi:hypothetical protein